MANRRKTSRWGSAAVLSILVLVEALLFSPSASAYAVITHEAIIDAEWDGVIQPLLLSRFPNATAEQLKEAHAYAYGGSVIQDMGYYPFGSRFFSHLTHYVRSGDFVQALFEESRDINDFAFALGALSHYCADIEGHSLAVNRSVALLYPRIHRKYGDWVTWEESPWAHMLTEFGFDTLEVVAKHNAPQAYRDWIGFKVPKPVLERAFKDTYGLDLSDQILNVNLALASYRHIANQFIPEMTEVAWAMRSKQLEKLARDQQHQRLYHLSRKSYAAWQKQYTKPGLGDKITAFFVRLIPPIGPLNSFQFHTPTPVTEKLFADSLKMTVEKYQSEIRMGPSSGFDPPDINLDTGRPTRPGEYLHCDLTYAELLDKLHKKNFADMSPDLRKNLLAFYSANADNSLSAHHRKWKKVEREVASLKYAGEEAANALKRPTRTGKK
jgi:Zinc dependent phospholipase C